MYEYENPRLNTDDIEGYDIDDSVEENEGAGGTVGSTNSTGTGEDDDLTDDSWAFSTYPLSNAMMMMMSLFVGLVISYAFLF